jgi:hypothetical protein
MTSRQEERCTRPGPPDHQEVGRPYSRGVGHDRHPTNDRLVPACREDRLVHGNGTTRAERATVWLTVLAGGLVLASQVVLSDLDWGVWQVVVTVVLVIDVLGGVAANGLNTAKRLYHRPLPADAGRFGRIVHRPALLTALHIHPIVVRVLFGGSWWWGPLWYVWALVGTVAVHAVPVYRQRPVALGIVTVGITLSSVLERPRATGGSRPRCCSSSCSPTLCARSPTAPPAHRRPEPVQPPWMRCSPRTGDACKGTTRRCHDLSWGRVDADPERGITSHRRGLFERDS